MSWLDRLMFWRNDRADVPYGAEEMAAFEPSPVPSTATPPTPQASYMPEPAQYTEVAAARSNFPQFSATANDRLDPRVSGLAARARLSLRNAYTPSQPITDQRMFAGRSQVLTALIRAIEDQRLHAIIYGERGIGKTSLLHVLSKSAQDARYLTVYISCGAAAGFGEVLNALTEQIPLLYHSEYGPTSLEGERGGTFASLIPEGKLSPRTASDLLAKVSGTRILVLLDEFDRVVDIAFRRAIAELIKDLSDRSVRVQLVIAGVAANLTELLEHIPSIQRNIVALQVPKMTADEIIDLVKGGESATGMTFTPGAVDMIVTTANGFPFLASLISHHAALAALQSDRLEITDEDVATAVAEALSEFKGRISAKSQAQMKRIERERLNNLMGALAGVSIINGGAFTPEDVQALQPAAAATNQDIVEMLAVSKVLIEAREGDLGKYYRFQEEGVAAYMWLAYIQNRFLVGQSAWRADAG